MIRHVHRKTARTLAFSVMSFFIAFVVLGNRVERTCAAPDRDLKPKNSRTRTYRFVARIQSNGGVAPFKVGETIDGKFTFDLDAKDHNPQRPRHLLDSPRNAITFQMGRLQFTGTGPIAFSMATFPHAEHFAISAPDLKLPDGWKMDHRQGSQGYGVLFQNAPSRGVIAKTGIPERISLPSFVTTREVRLSFFHGVRFPGGQVTGFVTVHARVEILEEFHDDPRR